MKLSHTVFALPFALAAMALAARENRGWPGWRVFLLVLGAMVCARTCAMAFNRIVDRKFDGLNPRTSMRHLPTGEISPGSAVALCVIGAAGLVACAWGLNPVCFYLSPVALFFVCFYSLTKRFTDYTHVFLGIALALAPIGATRTMTTAARSGSAASRAASSRVHACSSSPKIRRRCARTWGSPSRSMARRRDENACVPFLRSRMMLI